MTEGIHACAYDGGSLGTVELVSDPIAGQPLDTFGTLHAGLLLPAAENGYLHAIAGEPGNRIGEDTSGVNAALLGSSYKEPCEDSNSQENFYVDVIGAGIAASSLQVEQSLRGQDTCDSWLERRVRAFRGDRESRVRRTSSGGVPPERFPEAEAPARRLWGLGGGAGNAAGGLAAPGVRSGATEEAGGRGGKRIE